MYAWCPLYLNGLVVTFFIENFTLLTLCNTFCEKYSARHCRSSDLLQLLTRAIVDDSILWSADFNDCQLNFYANELNAFTDHIHRNITSRLNSPGNCDVNYLEEANYLPAVGL